ncbi:MAG TPA: hypothetical protein VNT27_05945, partial [Propionibacteriaceae bacterium]|nr:hypothetical protein [Propionibacteriaceae bacterium]
SALRSTRRAQPPQADGSLRGGLESGVDQGGGGMFAVIGQWRMDPQLGDEQHTGLQRIVAGVGQLPGLVAGYWTGEAGGSSSHTFIVFDDLAAAERFASDVRGNAENQRRGGVENLSLVLEEVAAHTAGRRG